MFPEYNSLPFFSDADRLSSDLHKPDEKTENDKEETETDEETTDEENNNCYDAADDGGVDENKICGRRRRHCNRSNKRHHNRIL